MRCAVPVFPGWRRPPKRRLPGSARPACPPSVEGADALCRDAAGPHPAGTLSPLTFAQLLRRSLETDAAGAAPSRDLLQAVLEQVRRGTGGRGPPHPSLPDSLQSRP